MPAVAKLAGSDYFAGMGGAGVAVAEDADVAGLSDGQRIFEKEGDAADGRIAGGDVVHGAGQRTIENCQDGLRLHRPAIVAAAVVAGRSDG